MPTSVYCDWCGKLTQKCAADMAKTQHHFCSRKCFAQWLSHTQKGVPRPEVAGPKPHLRNRVKIQCQYCGKEFEVKISHTHRRKYCSLECRNAGWVQSGKYAKENNPKFSSAPRICEYCGKEFLARASEIAKSAARYCSKECHYSAGRTETRCAFCGKVIQMPLNRAQSTERLFCDAACYAQWQVGPNNHNWKGGYEPYYGPNWRSQRRNARRRDGYTCQRCGITEEELNRQLDVHHIVSLREFGLERYKEANALSNLISLCNVCHLLVENGASYNEKEEAQLMRPPLSALLFL